MCCLLLSVAFTGYCAPPRCFINWSLRWNVQVPKQLLLISLHRPRSTCIIVQFFWNLNYICLVWIITIDSFFGLCILVSCSRSALLLILSSFFFPLLSDYGVSCCQVLVHTSLINAPVQAHLVREYRKSRVFRYPPPSFYTFKAIHSTVTAGACDAEPITLAPQSWDWSFPPLSPFLPNP